MEILAKLFGSATKVKMMRMFLFNEDNAYSFSEIVDRTKSSPKEVKKEILGFINIELIKSILYNVYII